MKDYYEAMIENYPNFSECSIQTFDDTGNKKPGLARIFENKKENLQEIVQLNEQNAGVFFSTNPMEKGKRDQNSVTGISARICEIDGRSKETQQKLIRLSPLKPSLVLESKSSYHMYWFAEDGTRDNRNVICNGLRNFFDGDPAVIDISRVLRMPGFYHCKDPDDKFMIEIFEFQKVLYKEEDMLKAYPDSRSFTELKRISVKKESQAKRVIGGGYFRDRVKEMDTMEVLGRISGTRFVGHETIDFDKNHDGTYQIIVDGKSTGAWIDKNNKIGSYSGGGPNRTNWVFWYGNCDGSELSLWIKENYPEMCDSPSIPKEEMEETAEIMSDVNLSRKIPYTRGLKSLDERFGKFDKGHFIVTVGESGSGKTEFTFFQARQNADEGVNVCYICLEMTKQKMIDRLAMKYANITKVQRNDGSVTDTQKIKFKQERERLRYYKNLDMVHIKKPTLDELVKYIESKHKLGFELFYIDNLGFVLGERNESELQLTARASRVLKDVTNNMSLSINLIHHFNKGGTKDRLGPRGLASIRSSGKIENDADFVLQIRRDMEDDDESTKRDVWVVLQKDREYGDPGKVIISFNRGDYEDRPQDPW